MKFGDYTPEHTLSYFNGYLYSGSSGSIIVASKATGALVAVYNNIVCSYPNYITSIIIDSFGFMAVGCTDFFVGLYDANNGTYLNQKRATLDASYFTAIDASGRFISMGYQGINIYYKTLLLG